MGMHGFCFQGWMFIPIAFCLFMMLFMGIIRGKGRSFGPMHMWETEPTTHKKNDKTPEHILKMRLAKGDITLEEYQQLKGCL